MFLDFVSSLLFSVWRSALWSGTALRVCEAPLVRVSSGESSQLFVSRPPGFDPGARCVIPKRVAAAPKRE